MNEIEQKAALVTLLQRRAEQLKVSKENEPMKTKNEPEGQARAGMNKIANGRREPKQQSHTRQADKFIEQTRATVRRTLDGGLVVERHICVLTYLPPAKAVWQRQRNGNGNGNTHHAEANGNQ